MVEWGEQTAIFVLSPGGAFFFFETNKWKVARIYFSHLKSADVTVHWASRASVREGAAFTVNFQCRTSLEFLTARKRWLFWGKARVFSPRNNSCLDTGRCCCTSIMSLAAKPGEDKINLSCTYGQDWRWKMAHSAFLFLCWKCCRTLPLSWRITGALLKDSTSWTQCVVSQWREDNQQNL